MEGKETNAEVQKNGADSILVQILKVGLLVSLGYANLSEWMIKNRLTYPKFVFWAGLIATGIVLATIAMTAIHTGFGRISEDIILQAGTAILLIAFLCVVLFMLWGVHLSLKYRAETAPPESQEPKAIPSENRRKWQPLSIAPDTLFYQTNGESMADFAKRVSAFTPTNAEWGVLIKRGELQATVFKKSGGIHFQRGGGEPFWDMLKEGEGRPPADFDFKNETQEEYEKYCYWFTMHYPAWAGVKKYEYDPENAHQTAVDILNAQAKTAVLTISFLLFCLPVFGQSKTRQVDEALGTRIREIPESGTKIVFAFQEGSKEKYYNRTGDGVSDYTTLLQTTSGLVRFEDEGGQFVAVSKNGEVVARGPHVERVNLPPSTASTKAAPNGYATESSTGDPIRPRGILQAPDIENTRRVGGAPMAIPDSAQTSEMLEGWKDDIRDMEYRTGKSAKPLFEFSWWLFGELFVGLFVLASVLWFGAKTASEEGIIGVWGETIFISSFLVAVHQNCSALLMCVLWTAEIFIFIKGAHLLIYSAVNIFIGCLIWLFGIWAMRKLHNKIVPNIKGLAGGAARNTNRGISPF